MSCLTIFSKTAQNMHNVFVQLFIFILLLIQPLLIILSTVFIRINYCYVGKIFTKLVRNEMCIILKVLCL